MNAKLAKEERRNLVKQMGETATDAFERVLKELDEARSAHRSLLHQHAAIAKEVAELRKETTTRIDAVAQWCEHNEKSLATTADAARLYTDALRVDVDALDVRAEPVIRFYRALRWPSAFWRFYRVRRDRRLAVQDTRSWVWGLGELP